MRKFVTLVLMLWLPLQAIAGWGAPACSSLNKAMRTPASQGHEHHASVDAAEHSAHHGSEQGDAEAADVQCADCVLACAVYVPSLCMSNVQRLLGTGPLPHGDEAFASAAGNRALEPPITAA